MKKLCAFLFRGAVFPQLHQQNNQWIFDLLEPAAPLTNTSMWRGSPLPTLGPKVLGSVNFSQT